MKVGTPVHDFESYLKWAISASERALKSTGREFHKGGLKAYRDALDKFYKFKKASNEHVEQCNGSPE